MANGPAQALNRALARVRGTVIGWLNSDDLYTPGAVERAVASLCQLPYCLMLYGEAEHIDADGNKLSPYPTLPPSTAVTRFSEGCFICQPTVFFQRSMYVLLGDLDESLKAAFDFDYWLRAFAAFPHRINKINNIQAKSRLHDLCITQNQRKIVMLEGMHVLAKFFRCAPKEWALTYIEEIARGVSKNDMMDIVKDFLNEAQPSLRAEDFSALVKQFLHTSE